MIWEDDVQVRQHGCSCLPSSPAPTVGPCNQRCYFCIGGQLSAGLSPSNLRLWPLRNLDAFIARMHETGTRKLILTGTTTDPQLYKHEARLVAVMRAQIPGIHIALHTNGLLLLRKLGVARGYDSITVSLNSFDQATYTAIHGTRSMPDLAAIMAALSVPLKLSCVLTKENAMQVSANTSERVSRRCRRKHVLTYANAS